MRSLLVTWLGLALFACTPEMDDSIEGLGDLDAGDDAGMDAGLTPSPRGYAVVSGDYSVVSIGLLDPDGELRTRELIHSGSASAGLVTALSGDVAIPSNATDPGVLTLLDRFRTDVVTRLDLASGEILGQVKTQMPNADNEDSYSSNPQDFLYVDERAAWVSRYEPNAEAEPDSLDRGADLLRIDPRRFERTEDRIGFEEWNATLERENADTGETETVISYARPGSIVPVASPDDARWIVVGIDRYNIAFDALGQGSVALVDLEAQRVLQMLELPGLASCSDLSAVPDDDTRVAVACTGYVRRDQRERSGLVMVVLGEDGALEVEHSWFAADDPDTALSIYGITAISATEVLVTAPGAVEASEPNDVLYKVSLDTGAQRAVVRAGGAFVLGSAAFDPRTGLLLVPDATSDDQGRPTAGVHRLMQGEDGAFEELDIIQLDEVLPSRSVRAFY